MKEKHFPLLTGNLLMKIPCYFKPNGLGAFFRGQDDEMPLPGMNCVLTDEVPACIFEFVLHDLDTGRMYRSNDLFGRGKIYLLEVPEKWRGRSLFLETKWHSVEKAPAGDADE